MPKSTFRKLRAAVVTICVATVTAGFFITPDRSHLSSAQSPTLSVVNQPDSPLQISGASVEPVDTQSLRIRLTLINGSNKAIRAYAINHDDVFEQQTAGGTQLSNVSSRKSVLLPDQSVPAQITIDQPMETVRSVSFSVDFVEFVDGTTWGADKAKSTERLKGQRAGARSSRSKLLRVLENEGAGSLSAAMSAGDLGIEPPADQSPEWKDGFLQGVGAIRGRILQALKTDDPKRVEAALRRHYDASEEN